MKDLIRVLRWIAICILLMAVNAVFNTELLPNVFLQTVSTIYLLTVSVVITVYYSNRVMPRDGLKRMMRWMLYMVSLILLLRGVKYSCFIEVDILARHTWYSYYIPMLLIPQFLFFFSILIFSKEDRFIPKGFQWMPAVTLALILLVLTNDLHQLVFRFLPGMVGWDDNYTYGWGFIAINIWEYGLYLASAVTVTIKCMIGSSKSKGWLILLPFTFGLMMVLLLITGNMPRLNGGNVIQFPEAYGIMAVGLLDACIQIGLIPTNTKYSALFNDLPIAAQITDRTGKVIYRSDSAEELSPERFAEPDGTRINAHTILHKTQIQGGYGFWQDDVTEIDRVHEELEETRKRLSEEAELLRLQNELKAKRIEIEQRSHVYDQIFSRTRSQSTLISELMEKAAASTDPAVKNDCRNGIILLGTYIKRFANLMLISIDSDVIRAEELGISIAELVRQLKPYSIPGEVFCTAEGVIRRESALTVFETVRKILIRNLMCLHGVLVNISETDESIVVKLISEGVREPLSADDIEQMSSAGIAAAFVHEDNTMYFRFELTKGGTAA